MSEWHARREAADQNKVAICMGYRDGLSTGQLAIKFSVSQRTVMNILNRSGVPTRSRNVANALRWKEPQFRDNQVAKRKGKPTWALGKTWIIGRPVFKPKLRGPGNPNWKGGTTALASKIRQLSSYRIWRRAVFVRDDFTCQSCGVRGGRLDADHIHTFASILRNFSIKSVADALGCGALWDISNGRTLCRECHRLTPTFANKRSSAERPVEEYRRAA